MQSGKSTSMSSPSIKSGSDAHSSGQPSISSPMSIPALTAGLVDDNDGGRMHGVAVRGRGFGVKFESWSTDVLSLSNEWFLQFQVADLAHVLREMVDLGGPTTVTAGAGDPQN
uniref:(northern house mosquito) hypothetical protein n=1 Tax=Culex pipiens TaxID=7175 RepID=A0A8D8ERN1_CULPI